MSGMGKNYTLVLSEEEAAKINAIVGPFSGSVGGFCRNVLRDYLNLHPDQIAQVRAIARKMGEENVRAKNRK